MRLRYTLVEDTNSLNTREKCANCNLQLVINAPISYSYKGYDELCFDCWDEIRKVTIRNSEKVKKLSAEK